MAVMSPKRKGPSKVTCEGCYRWTLDAYVFQHETEPRPYLVCCRCFYRLLAEQSVRVNGAATHEGDDALSLQASFYHP